MVVVVVGRGAGLLLVVIPPDVQVTKLCLSKKKK